VLYAQIATVSRVDYAVHHLALGEVCNQLENLACHEELPEKVWFCIVAPSSWKAARADRCGSVYALLPLKGLILQTFFPASYIRDIALRFLLFYQDPANNSLNPVRSLRGARKNCCWGVIVERASLMPDIPEVRNVF